MSQPASQREVDTALGLLISARAALDAAVKLLTPPPEPEPEVEEPEAPPAPTLVRTMGGEFVVED